MRQEVSHRVYEHDYECYDAKKLTALALMLTSNAGHQSGRDVIVYRVTTAVVEVKVEMVVN